MAPKKETSLELCSRATTLGNSISIRMLEYLSTAKHPVQGFQLLAIEFLDLSSILLSIEAGLTDAARKRNLLPADITQELDRRFRQVNDEFSLVNTMVLKFVENASKKGGFGKAFRMMFADTDVDKLRHTLMKSRDSLRMSSAMFRYTLGDAKLEPQTGIGYAGLAAALERLNTSKPNGLPPMQPPPSSPPPEVPMKHSLVQTIPSERSFMTRSPMPAHTLNHSPPGRTMTHSDRRPLTPMRDQQSTASFQRDDHHKLSQGIVDLHNNWRAPSAPSIRSTETPHSIRDTVYQHNGSYHGDSGYAEFHSDESTRVASRPVYMEEEMYKLSLDERFSGDSPYRRLDASGEPHWTPRQPTGSMAAGGKAALVEAVQYKKHRMLEQLLDGGARADQRVEANMLRTAAQHRDTESISLLLRHGANANGVDNQGYTALYTATQVSFLEGAKLLLQAGADPNASAGPESESALCLAACENRIDLVQMYMAHGGDANLIMESGSTTLIQCMNKTVSPKLVEILLKGGVDVNAKNGEGATALFQAIQANRVDIMSVLLDHGANPNLPAPKHPLWPSTYKPKALQLLLARGADTKKTPGIVELAASLKKLESVTILINAGVSPNIRKDGVYTPLCSAIRDNSADIVSYLLEHGADPNLNAAEYPAFKCITHNRLHFLPQLVAAGADLRSPKGIAETAVAHNNQEALMYLLEQGVNLNDRSPEGNTALTTAIRDDRIEMVELLLANGADPAVRGADWPLCMAVKRPPILSRLLTATPNPRAFRGIIEMAVVANQLESVKLLLKAGVSVEDKNCGVFSPLTTAIRERHKPIVRYLLDEANADPNVPGEHLPLVKALRRLLPGDTEILQMLLTRGADINKMHRGWNAVLQAVENGDADILRLLLEKGGSADLQAIDESGRPVIDIVSERGWEEGIALLFPNAAQSVKP